MKVVELAARLQQLFAEHGDVEVFVRDADTDWFLAVHTAAFSRAANGIEIAGDYHEDGNITDERCYTSAS